MNPRLHQQVDDVVRAVLRSARGRLDRLHSVTVGLAEGLAAEAFAAAVRRALATRGAPPVDVQVLAGNGPACLLAVEYRQ